MIKNNNFNLFIKWEPQNIDRGGYLTFSLLLIDQQIKKIEMKSSKDSYFSRFEESLITCFFDFLIDRPLSSVQNQSFREIESYLRVDNHIKESRNDEEGELLINELKNTLTIELILENLRERLSPRLRLNDLDLVQKIKIVKEFLISMYNPSILVIEFNQECVLLDIKSNFVILECEKILPEVSFPLLAKVFKEKFFVDDIKLVAKQTIKS